MFSNTRVLLRKTGGGGKGWGELFFLTEGRDENQDLEGRSQTNTQVAMPRESSKATQNHIASKPLTSAQSGRVWVNLIFKRDFATV